jgi:hypothetical protein
VVNLDPAAEQFDYEPLADVRDLIQLEDVMEDKELKFGPNGGTVPSSYLVSLYTFPPCTTPCLNKFILTKLV